MNYTYKDIINSYSEEKKLSDRNHHFILFLIYRPLSFPLTWLSLKLNIKPNYITLLTIIISIFLIFLFQSDFILYKYIACLLMFIFLILDCVDGNIARTTKKSNKLGEFLDLFSGLLFWSVIFPSISIGLNNNEIIFMEYKFILIHIGYTIPILFLFSRFISQQTKKIIGDNIYVVEKLFPIPILILNSFFDLVPIIYLISLYNSSVDVFLYIYFIYILSAILFILFNSYLKISTHVEK